MAWGSRTTGRKAVSVDLSAKQAEVVCSVEPGIVVTAAAGAGKTRVLTARYLSEVEKGISPDAILTITFTRKAAAEMKQRIVEQLRASGRLAEAQIAETGPIQTIHSFCERTLRENAVDAGLDPEFEILAEGDGGRAAREAVQTALSWGLEESEEARQIAERISGKREDRVDAFDYLLQTLEKVLSQLRTSGFTLEEIEERHASPEGLLSLWQAFAVATLHEEEQRMFRMTDDFLPFQERVRKALEDAKVSKRRPRWTKAVGDSLEAAQHSCAVSKLVAASWRSLNAIMQRDQRLDFDELEARAIRLLENSKDARQRLAERYKSVLIDESQDMNPLQHRLVKGLAPAFMMMVGDSQQSIYRFRQADPKQFEDLKGSLSHHHLSKNYRSEPGLLSFVDHLFGNLFGESYVAMSEPRAMDLDRPEPPNFEGVEFWRSKIFDPDQVAEWTRQLIEEEDLLPGQIAILTRTNTECAKLDASLKRRNQPCQVIGGTEMFYTRLEVRDLANALRVLADPFDDFAMLAFLRGPAVELSMDSIAVLAMGGDVYERLSGFEPPVSQDAAKLRTFLAWFEPLRAFADRLPAWEALGEFLARSPYLECLARRGNWRQALMNTRKLVAIASREAHLGPLQFAERIREVQRLLHREGDAPVLDERDPTIKIMTIHKAKGLEFDVVVLPTFFNPYKPPHSAVMLERQGGLLAANLTPETTFMVELLRQGETDRENEERLRVLYVAMTRAKKRLCFCGHPQAKAGSLAQKVLSLAKIQGSLPPSIRVRDPLT